MTRESEPHRKRIPDELMLDWIDGALSSDEECRLAREYGPEVMSLVQRLRADRDAIQSIASERAPADLHDRMMEVFEREALFEPQSDSIAISKMQVSVTSTRLRSTPAIPLALAAGLLLLVSGGAYLMLGQPRVHPAPIGGGQVASAEAGDEDPSPVDTSAARIADMQVDQPVEVAAVDPEPEPAPKAVKAPMTEDRVLRLAREGRVVMRVVGDDLAGIERLKSDGKTPVYGRDWRLRDGVSAELAKAVAPSGLPFGLNHPDEFAFASSDAVGMIGPRAALNWPVAAFADRASKVRATWIADVPMTESALKAFRAVMSERLDAKVVFEELQAPVEVPPTLDPAATLWWTRGSSRWIDRVSMPVVIEER